MAKRTSVVCLLLGLGVVLSLIAGLSIALAETPISPNSDGVAIEPVATPTATSVARAPIAPIVEPADKPEIATPTPRPIRIPIEPIVPFGPGAAPTPTPSPTIET